MTLLLIIFVAVLPAIGATVKERSSMSVVHETIFTKKNGNITGLALRLPLPSDHKSRAYSQKIKSISVLISPEPSRIEDISDRSGNSFKKILWGTVNEAKVVLSFTATQTQRSVALKSKAPYPPKVSKRFATYMEYTPGERKISKDLDEIVFKTTRGITTEMEAVNSILEWVHNNINLKDSGPGTGASYSLSKGYGNSGGYPNLVASLLRRARIPARIVYGLKVEKVSRSHIWVEIYFPDMGWVPYDPSTNELAFSLRLIKFTEGPSSGPIIKSWSTSGSKPAYSERTDVN